jgi:hypothetical protein
MISTSFSKSLPIEHIESYEHLEPAFLEAFLNESKLLFLLIDKVILTFLTKVFENLFLVFGRMNDKKLYKKHK